MADEKTVTVKDTRDGKIKDVPASETAEPQTRYDSDPHGPGQDAEPNLKKPLKK